MAIPNPLSWNFARRHCFQFFWLTWSHAVQPSSKGGRAEDWNCNEADIKAKMLVHWTEILALKRIMVRKEMLEEVNYPDMEMVSEMINGTQLTGIIPRTGIFEKAFKPGVHGRHVLGGWYHQTISGILLHSDVWGPHS